MQGFWAGLGPEQRGSSELYTVEEACRLLVHQSQEGWGKIHLEDTMNSSSEFEYKFKCQYLVCSALFSSEPDLEEEVQDRRIQAEELRPNTCR